MRGSSRDRIPALSPLSSSSMRAALRRPSRVRNRALAWVLWLRPSGRPSTLADQQAQPSRSSASATPEAAPSRYTVWGRTRTNCSNRPAPSSNAARALELYPAKGHVAPGADADLLLLGPDLELDTVIARGKMMLENGRLLVKGTYETNI